MLERLVSWDRSLLLLLNGSGSPMLDNAFWTVTSTLTWIPFFAVMLYAIFRNNDIRRFLLLAVMIALLVTATDMFASSLCKPLFHRLRPTHNPDVYPYLHIVNGYLGGMYGFISSHAANTFGMALFLSLVFGSCSMAVTLFSWAALSTYSRLYLGVHYPADVFCGMVSGFAWAWIFHYAYRRISGLTAGGKTAAAQSLDRGGASVEVAPGTPGVKDGATETAAVAGGGYRRADLAAAKAAFALTLLYVVARAALQALTF